MTIEQPEMYSREWYNEYFRRAVNSRAHSKFCEKVYGKDLCQHGMMDMEELNFLVTLIKPHSKILEIGCSNGYITEYIHDHTQSEILGIDYSDVAIKQAKERIDRNGLQFARLDISTEEIPGDNYDYIIMIDSIYFVEDIRATIARIAPKLGLSGKILITYFQISEAENEEERLPDKTDMAEALKKSGLEYRWYEFTENVRKHWLINYQVGEELRDAFKEEGNEFLYQARAGENRYFKENVEKNAITRYMYIAEKVRSA